MRITLLIFSRYNEVFKLMKKSYQILLAALLTIFALRAQAQVGVGTTTPDASAQLDVTSNSKGVLIPRMTSSERTGISPAAEGLLVYQTDAPAGFYYYSASQWVRLVNSTETTTANIPSLYAANTLGTVYTVLLGGTSVAFPSNQLISTGYSVNAGNTFFTVASAGRYQLSYRLKLTASLSVSTRIVVNGVSLPGSVISPVVGTDTFSSSVIADLPANSTIQVQFFGFLGLATLTADSQYLSVLKLQ